MSSMSYLAPSYLSLCPSINTFLIDVLGISFLATYILHNDFYYKYLIVSPPFPIIRPTHSFGTGMTQASGDGGP
jgi:hypothetical protein